MDVFGGRLNDAPGRPEPEIPPILSTRKDIKKMDYLVKSMKSLNLTTKDIEKTLPCSIGLLTSRNPMVIEGTSVFESEIEHARKIP